jgi:hypothetical protein
MQSRARTQFPYIVASEIVAAVFIVAGTADPVVKGSYIFLDYSRRSCLRGLR